MSRANRSSGPYVSPLTAVTGVELTDEKGRGAFTLIASTTYYYPLGGRDAATMFVHVTGDAAVVITSITIEDCGMDEAEVSNYAASTAGDWVKDNGTLGVTSTVGTGWTPTARTVAVTGGNAGGATFQLPDRGAYRTRLAIVVGATGGVVRVGTWGKE